MSVSVTFFSCFEDLVGERRTDLSQPGTTLRELIDGLEARYPGFKVRFLEADGETPKLHYQVAINREFTKDLAAPLKDGDEIAFLMPIAGG